MEVQDAILIQDLKADMKEFAADWNLLKSCLMKYKEQFGEVDIEEIMWAYGVIYTRAFCKFK